MSRKRKATGILLAAVFLTAFLFRLQILPKIQIAVIGSLSDQATLFNGSLIPAGSPHSGHRIYRLKGTERLFPHRVNSLRRFRFPYHDFKGFECDIQYDSEAKSIRVNHDGRSPADPLFSDFLQADPHRKIFWMDLKNMDTSVVRPFSTALVMLDTKFGLKNRVILESTDTGVVAALSRQGYFTSFYVPQQDAASLDTALLHSFCSRGNGAAVSQDVLFYRELKKGCPTRKMLTWDLTFSHTLDRSRLLQHLNDPALLVCLLNIKSPGHR